MRKRSAIIRGILILGIGLALVPSDASAEPNEDEVGAAVLAAKEAARQGRCDDAAEALQEIDGLETRARLLAGQCRIETGLYPEALADFERLRDAKDLTPTQRGDVDLFRGIALYHLERYTESAAALDLASGVTGEEAQLSLYQGLIALRNGDPDGAAPALESAARLSPEKTEPVASFYAGLAWQRASERTKARDAFRRVVHIDGDGPWGQQAEKLLESTELFPYYVRGSVGLEYDDNVILRGGVTQTTGTDLDQSGEKDGRGIWEIEAGVQLFSKDDWSAGLTGGYIGTAQFDLSQLDVHYPTIGPYVARRLGPQTVAQARYEFGHAWLNEDSYLYSHLNELAVVHTWPKAGTTLVMMELLWNDLRFDDFDVQDGPVGGTPGDPCVPPLGVACGPAGLDESAERDRDGMGLGGAVDHRVNVPISERVDEIIEEVEVGGGYHFRWYDSEGDEWKHFAHTFSLGLIVEFPLDISLAANASYQYRDFANPSTFPDAEVVDELYALSGADREEHEMNFEAEIEKDLTPNFSVSTRYAYQETESNRRVYDFTRHIVGGYVNFRFD